MKKSKRERNNKEIRRQSKRITYMYKEGQHTQDSPCHTNNVKAGDVRNNTQPERREEEEEEAR